MRKLTLNVGQDDETDEGSLDQWDLEQANRDEREHN